MSALSTNPYYIPSALEGNNWNSQGVNGVTPDGTSDSLNGLANLGQSSGNPYGMIAGTLLRGISNQRDILNYNPNPTPLNNSYVSTEKQAFDLGEERDAAAYIGSGKHLEKEFSQKANLGEFLSTGQTGFSPAKQMARHKALIAREEMKKQLEFNRNKFNNSNMAYDNTNAAMNLQAARGI